MYLIFNREPFVFFYYFLAAVVQLRLHHVYINNIYLFFPMSAGRHGAAIILYNFLPSAAVAISIQLYHPWSYHNDPD